MSVGKFIVAIIVVGIVVLLVVDVVAQVSYGVLEFDNSPTFVW